jgi:hypothetical protein
MVGRQSARQAQGCVRDHLELSPVSKPSMKITGPIAVVVSVALSFAGLVSMTPDGGTTVAVLLMVPLATNSSTVPLAV